MLFLLGPMLCVNAHASLYRVEVIVIGHSEGRSDQRQVSTLHDFSQLLDPAWIAAQQALQPALAEPHTELEEMSEADLVEPSEGAPDVESPTWQDAAATDSSASSLNETMDAPLTPLTPANNLLIQREPALAAQQGPTDTGPVYPITFSNLPSLGPEMARAWQRIDNNPAFEALAWRAWIQPIERRQSSPAIRLHDHHALRVDWAKLPDHSPYLISPWPHSQFRLDGSLRLVQRQFLHAELNLHWREPVAAVLGSAPPSLLANEDFFEHRLMQSRTIRPDRLEYFDSSRIGVLLRIERWQPHY